MTTDPAVTAAAEALSIIGGVPDIWDLRAAGIAVAAARPIIEAEERERILNREQIDATSQGRRPRGEGRVMTDLDLDATLAAGEQMCQIFTVGPRGTSWRIDDVSVRAVQAALPALVVALREARTAIARVRALCASADDSEYTTTFAADVLAALDVRHDPSATTDSPTLEKP